MNSDLKVKLRIMAHIEAAVTVAVASIQTQIYFFGNDDLLELYFRSQRVSRWLTTWHTVLPTRHRPLFLPDGIFPLKPVNRYVKCSGCLAAKFASYDELSGEFSIEADRTLVSPTFCDINLKLLYRVQVNIDKRSRVIVLFADVGDPF